MKRDIDIVVISDIHLGSRACRAQEILNYLSHIQPKILILNGDVIDTDKVKKRNFPALHFEVIQEILHQASQGTKVYYITGNYDDTLRNYSNFSSGNIHLRDKLVLQVKGKKYWFFHGDVFDTVIKYSPLFTHFGKQGYNLLLWLNRMINRVRCKFNQPRISFSQKIKNNFEQSLKYIHQFETTALRLAEQKGYDYVVCGHVHKATMRVAETASATTYMNSGDWVESLTALEYQWGRWSI